MDFVADKLFNSTRIRAVTVVDNFRRECLLIHVDKRIQGEHVVDLMKLRQTGHDRCPDRIQVDNGSEFISKVLDKWTRENKG